MTTEERNAALAAALRGILTDCAADEYGGVFAPGPAAVKAAWAALEGVPVAYDARLAAALEDVIAVASSLLSCDSVDSSTRFMDDAAARIGRAKEALAACGEG